MAVGFYALAPTPYSQRAISLVPIAAVRITAAAMVRKRILGTRRMFVPFVCIMQIELPKRLLVFRIEMPPYVRLGATLQHPYFILVLRL